jgi:beta-phosphoglucomutase
MTSWPAAVLFDFDGVIVNSEPLHCTGFQQVLAGVGIDLTEDAYYRELIGFDDRNAFAHIFRVLGRPLDEPTARRLVRDKAAAAQRMIDGGDFTALPGVDALVRALAAAHVPRAICSGALRPEIERMLDGIGLREFFPVIVAAEDVTVGKPDPSGYLLTIARLGRHAGVELAPADCLVIEDAPTVIQSVRAAGFRTMGVASSYPLEALSHADYAVARLTPDEVGRHVPELKVRLGA